MNVVPLKAYAYDEWCRIVLMLNIMRADARLTPWSEHECWELWRTFFSAKA